MQNLDSSEISLTDVSHYFDSDPTKLVAGLRNDGKTPAAYIADTTTANAQACLRMAGRSCARPDCCDVCSTASSGAPSQRWRPCPFPLGCRCARSARPCAWMRAPSCSTPSGEAAARPHAAHRVAVPAPPLLQRARLAARPQQSPFLPPLEIQIQIRYEGMLSSGYEGVREIQKRMTNTMGWSATSGMVDNWVYDGEHPHRSPCPASTACGGRRDCQMFFLFKVGS